jgi:hypothetical protein
VTCLGGNFPCQITNTGIRSAMWPAGDLTSEIGKPENANLRSGISAASSASVIVIVIEPSNTASAVELTLFAVMKLRRLCGAGSPPQRSGVPKSRIKGVFSQRSWLGRSNSCNSPATTAAAPRQRQTQPQTHPQSFNSRNIVVLLFNPNHPPLARIISRRTSDDPSPPTTPPPCHTPS